MCVERKSYEYYSILTNSRLNTIYRIMKHDDVAMHLHRCAGMGYLLFKRRYKPEHIVDLTNLKKCEVS